MGDEPEDTSSLTCRCPFCEGTGTFTSPDSVRWALHYQAIVTSVGSFPDRLEELREGAVDCLSHLPNDVFAARGSLYSYLGSVYQLMYFLGADQNTREVFMVLQHALLDLQRGVENPLFVVDKKSRVRSTLDLEVLVFASAVKILIFARPCRSPTT